MIGLVLVLGILALSAVAGLAVVGLQRLQDLRAFHRAEAAREAARVAARWVEGVPRLLWLRPGQGRRED